MIEVYHLADLISIITAYQPPDDQPLGGGVGDTVLVFGDTLLPDGSAAYRNEAGGPPCVLTLPPSTFNIGNTVTVTRGVDGAGRMTIVSMAGDLISGSDDDDVVINSRVDSVTLYADEGGWWILSTS